MAGRPQADRRDGARGSALSRRALLTTAFGTAAGTLATAAPLYEARPGPADGTASGAVRGSGGTPPDQEACRSWPRPFRPDFPPAGLVTNEYAYRRPDAAGARTTADWQVTSGSLFARRGCGWTGVPDGEAPGPDSRDHTGSAVFRLVGRRRDFGDATVRCWVLLDRPGSTARTPAVDWDGGHLWLRYHGPQELYALSFRRRDGAVVLKRKHPSAERTGDTEGEYTTLAEGRHALPYGRWHQVTAAVRTVAGDTVRLRLALNGRTVLDAEDRAPGRLVAPGGVGLRGDNTEMLFAHFSAQ
ncbi:hypothetical protein [Streptomyces sp. CA-132043]|uniref:hypothetical protein n=1 Tax=Streptomyces sp. CA-132043 TaxID=3240048 RepID=UPI003D90ED0C